jgi:hypothetical protein
MNRYVVALAASVLGTACSSRDTCDSRSVAVKWPFYLLAGGTYTADCNLAPVVSVFMDDAQVVNPNTLDGNFACTDAGVIIQQVPNGSSHLFTVEGLDSAGAIVFRAEVTVGSSNCTSLLVEANPSEGYAHLQYDFYQGSTPLSTGQDTCATSSQLWLSITDTVAHQKAYLLDTVSAAPACESSQRTLSLLLASGTYTLDWMEERVGTLLTASSSCSAEAFAINGPDPTTVPVALDTEAVVACH